MFIYEHGKPEQIDIQLHYIIFCKYGSSKYKQRVCLHYGLNSICNATNIVECVQYERERIMD